MGKQWGSCGLGILLCALIIACASEEFWLGLDRGLLYAAQILAVSLALVAGASGVLAAAFWGYNRVLGSPRPFSHCLWGGTIVVIGLCALIWFLKRFFSII